MAININNELFKRYAPKKKIEIIENLTSSELLATTPATMERIIKEAGRYQYKSVDKRLFISRDRQEGNSWNSMVEALELIKGKLYLEDFSKPKIVWKIIGNQMAFAYDANNYVMNNACYIMTGDHLDYLLAVLNSQAITWYSYVTNMNKTGVGDVQVGGQNIATFPIPFYDANKIELIELAELANSIINKNINLPFIDSKIEGLVSMIYGFTSEETNFLHSFVSSLRKSI